MLKRQVLSKVCLAMGLLGASGWAQEDEIIEPTSILLDTAGFQTLTVLFEDLCERRIPTDDLLSPHTAAFALAKLDGGQGERYLADKYPSLSNRTKTSAASALGHHGRDLHTFLALLSYSTKAKGHSAVQLNSAASFIARRMLDDETWLSQVAFDLAGKDENLAALASFYIAQAGGDVARVLLEDALASARQGQLLSILQQIPGGKLDERVMDAITEVLTDAQMPEQLRLSTIDALFRCGQSGMDRLIDALEAMPATPENAALRKKLKATLVKMAGVDCGNSIAAWRKQWAKMGDVPADSMEYREKSKLSAAPPVPATGLEVLALGLMLALGAVYTVGVRQSMLGGLALIPVAGLLTVIGTIENLEQSTPAIEPQRVENVDLPLPAFRDKMWSYLKQCGGNPTRPPFADLRCSPAVMDGTALRPWAEAMEHGRMLELLRVHHRAAKAYLYCDDGRVLVGRLTLNYTSEGELSLRDIVLEAVLEHEGGLPTPVKASLPPAPKAEPPRIVRWPLALSFASALSIAVALFWLSRIRPWERTRAKKAPVAPEPTKDDAAPIPEPSNEKARLEPDYAIAQALQDIGRKIPVAPVERPKSDPGAALSQALQDVSRRVQSGDPA